MSTQQRPIPETDAVIFEVDTAHEVVHGEFAKRLERERDEARVEIQAMRNEIERLKNALRGAQQGSEEARRAIEKLARKHDEALSKP